MEFLIGCKNPTENPTLPTIVEEGYRTQFTFIDITKVHHKGLRLSEDFNIVTTEDITFQVEVRTVVSKLVCLQERI